MAISEVCPTTGEYCFNRDLVKGTNLGITTNKPKLQDQFEIVAELEAESIIAKVDMHCTKKRCAVLALGNAIAIRNQAAQITESKFNG